MFPELMDAFSRPFIAEAKEPFEYSPYKCQLCGDTFRTGWEVLAHVREEHVLAIEELYHASLGILKRHTNLKPESVF